MSAAGPQGRGQLHAGSSAPSPLDQVSDAAKQATIAMRAAATEGTPVRRFADLSTYALLLASQSRESLLMVARSALQPLVDHDAAHGSQLLAALEAFLTHGGQAVPAAAALGVHRHTVRNRMRKVGDLTGRDLNSAHHRTELWLALKAYELAGLGPR